MKPALIFSSLILFSLSSIAASSLSKLIEARALEKSQPDKACEIEQKLSQDKDFVLQDIAFLRQGMICEAPLEQAPYDLNAKPWLNQADLERRARLHMKKGEWLSAVETRAELAKLEKSQKAQLASLKATEEWLKTTSAEAEVQKQALETIQRVKSEIAPRFLPKPTPAQALRVAQDFLSARQFNEARKWASKVQSRPGASFEDQLTARRIRRSSYKLEQQTDSFLNALKSDWIWAQAQKNPHKAVEMGLLYAKALWTEGKNSDAKKVLSQIEAKFGKSVRVNEVFFIRGKMSEEMKDWRAALAHYERATALDLKSTTDKKIQFAKAWVAWKSNENEKALTALDALIGLGMDDPFESSRALFWKSRTLRRMGRTDEAKAALKQLQTQDPLGFYGALSYYELQEKMPPLKVPKTPSEFQKSPLYDAAYFQALAEAGESEILQAATAVHLQKVRPEEPVGEWLPLFLAAARANSYLPLFSQISALTPENRSLLLEKDPQLIFPLDFKELIVNSAKKFDIPPELVFSIIRQESAFNPFARSPADAFGLMQLLPSISKAYYPSVGIEVDSFEDLYDPPTNVPYGSALLKDLLRRHDAKLYLAAAAYNANEKALKMWLKMRWNGDPVEFIEEIPYEETRAYVKLIIRNFVFYSRLIRSGENVAFPKVCLGD